MKISVQDKLKIERDKHISGEQLLEEIKSILAEDDARDADILKEIYRSHADGEDFTNNFNPDLLDTDYIYHENQIKHICTIYRLRFLDSHFFKDDLPYEALIKTKKLQKEHQTTLSGFKIMAPAKSFRLKNADDPLLFAPIGNGYYYLIHKWGNDLNRLRKIRMWPWRNLDCMIAFLITLTLLITIAFPKYLFTRDLTPAKFIAIAVLLFPWVGGLAMFYIVKNGKNFSHVIWKSVYFNSK